MSERHLDVSPVNVTVIVSTTVGCRLRPPTISFVVGAVHGAAVQRWERLT